MPKSSRKTMRTGTSGSESDYSGSSRSSGKKTRSRKTTVNATDVFPPKPRRGHPNQTPKPELRAKMMAPVLARIGSHVANVSDVVVGTHYLVMDKNRKNQPAVYCMKATSASGDQASFYMRDFRSAGFGYKAASLMTTANNIYKITPELMATLEAEGMWFTPGEYDL